METFPESWSCLLNKTTSSSHLCSLTHFFRNFLAKNFVDSIIFVTFAVEFERTEKNGRDDNSN